MDDNSFLVARDLTELHEAFKLVPRGVTCVKCDDTSKLSCPKCGDGEDCQFTVPTNCGECPSAVCLPGDDPPTSGGSEGGDGGGDSGGGGGGGPNGGAIAGGVIGGLAAVAIITYLVWRFLIRPKRSQIPQSIYESESNAARNTEKDGASRMTKRSSTHTVHSIASTVLTRASNIIQIAYIPGVTNRATPTSPDVLVPPVPPIPMHHTQGQQREADQEDQHYFVPGDLRDSTYSGVSGYSDRTSYARTSYAPRSSIASTIYGKQAQVLTPAQTGMRAKPTMVSVKSLGPNGAASPPPVPSIDFEKFGNGSGSGSGSNNRPKSGASAFSVGSTFLNNANTATQARAQVVKVGGGLKKVEVGGNKSDAGTSSPVTLAPATPDTPGQSSTRDSNAVTLIEDSPAEDQGPFSDPPPQKAAAGPSLGAVIEDESESSRSGGKDSRPPSSSRARGTSPFGDEHATRD